MRRYAEVEPIVDDGVPRIQQGLLAPGSRRRHPEWSEWTPHTLEHEMRHAAIWPSQNLLPTWKETRTTRFELGWIQSRQLASIRSGDGTICRRARFSSHVVTPSVQLFFRKTVLSQDFMLSPAVGSGNID